MQNRAKQIERRILWACMVYEKEVNCINRYLAAVKNLKKRPEKLLVIDSDESALIKTTVTQNRYKWVKYVANRVEAWNHGFNPSFNKAVEVAIGSKKYDWLATMTVRAIPSESWLEEALEVAKGNQKIGMVTTLHLNNANKIHSLGHFLGPAGECFWFARHLHPEMLHDSPLSTATDTDNVVWSPCSGGALYKVEAMRKAKNFLDDDSAEFFQPYGFKSYNCPVMGFLIRAAGYKNAVAQNSICYRDDSQSTSAHANTKGLLINQEINRMASVQTFWPKDLREKACMRYETQERSRADLKAIDKRIILTLAENLNRKYSGKTKKALNSHLSKHKTIKDWMRNNRQ